MTPELEAGRQSAQPMTLPVRALKKTLPGTSGAGLRCITWLFLKRAFQLRGKKMNDDTPSSTPRTRERSLWQVSSVAGLAIAISSVGLCWLAGCTKGAPTGASEKESKAAEVRPELPPPFDKVRIGMSIAEVQSFFPAVEPWGGCKVNLVGYEPPRANVPEDKERARSLCPNIVDYGAASMGEILFSLDLGTNERRAEHRGLVGAGFVRAVEQVRAVLRAGAIERADIVSLQSGASSRNESSKWLPYVAAELFDGSMAFVKPRDARRPICALVKEDCSGLDPERVRQYVRGDFSLNDLDREARRRVANSRCRSTYVAGERMFQLEMVSQTGAFAGIGLARSSRSDRQLDPERPNTFAVYKTRSRLDYDAAKFAVRVVNGLDATAKYFEGSVLLEPGAGAPGSALVWATGGKISRVLVNVDDDDAQGTLRELYGADPANKDGVSIWELENGIVAKLDATMARSLVVESAGATPGNAGKVE